jgi:hypothetical protein
MISSPKLPLPHFSTTRFLKLMNHAMFFFSQIGNNGNLQCELNDPPKVQFEKVGGDGIDSQEENKVFFKRKRVLIFIRFGNLLKLR